MRMDLLVTIIVAVFASTGFWSFVQWGVQKKTTEKTASEKLLLGIAFQSIVELCQHHLEVGHISTEEYKELNHYLFKPYKELGGDGTAEKLMEEVKKLPMKEG